MQLSMRQIRKGSPELRAATSAARSARNLKTRQANEREERVAEGARRRRKRISDREAEAFLRRRVRVHIAAEDRSSGSNRTPHKLTNRGIKEIYAGTWGSNSRRGSDGLSSIHFEFVPRGFGSKKGRAWRTGEAERASLYATAHESLEGGELGWRSNIATDRNELRHFWRVLEGIEQHDRSNANVYITEVIELPCEASPRLRRRMVGRMVERLEERGLAYVAAIHNPDRGGDQRNFHLHLMYSLRPAQRAAAYDWEFGISKVADINTKDGIREQRRTVVRDINASLHEADIGKRYTPLSNAARGLEPSTQTKVGQKKTWAQRRMLAAEQKVTDIHRLLALAANLRACAERVRKAVTKAEERVSLELRRRVREIDERKVAREETLSALGERVVQARSTIFKQYSARASAAWNEMLAGSPAWPAISDVPRPAQSRENRVIGTMGATHSSDHNGLCHQPDPLSDNLTASTQSQESLEDDHGSRNSAPRRTANDQSVSDYVPTVETLLPTQGLPTARSMPGRGLDEGETKEQANSVADSGRNNLTPALSSISPASKALVDDSESQKDRPMGPAAQEIIPSTAEQVEDRGRLLDSQTGSSQKAQDGKPDIAVKPAADGDKKAPSQIEHSGAPAGILSTKAHLKEVLRRKRQKSEASAASDRTGGDHQTTNVPNGNEGVVGREGCGVGEAIDSPSSGSFTGGKKASKLEQSRQAAIRRRIAAPDSEMPRSDHKILPKSPDAEGPQSKSGSDKENVQSPRSSHSRREQEPINHHGHDAIDNKSIESAAAAEQPAPFVKKKSPLEDVEAVKPERVSSKGPFSATMPDWHIPKKERDR